MLFPATSLFITTLVLGTLISISSLNWLYIWMGLELNLLSFIPVIAANSCLQETESAVKYFVTQAVGRGLLLLGTLTCLATPIFPINSSSTRTIVILRLLLKTGTAPLHWWLPSVIARISWLNCILLATWQKIAPLILLMTIFFSIISPIIIIASAIRALIGGIGGINQRHLRPILAFSSIGHLAWIIAIIISGDIKIFILYFSIYCLINSLLITNIHWITQLKSKANTALSSIPLSFFLIVIVLLLSLGGLPPLLGFLPKWIIIINLSLTPNTIVLLIVLIFGSLLNLFYYLSIIFRFLLNQPPKFLYSPTSSLLAPLAIIIGGILSLVVIIWSCSWFTTLNCRFKSVLHQDLYALALFH